MKTNDIVTIIKPNNKGDKLLLHACCGPCSLEPYRLLKDAGWDITIIYSNSNIYPKDEYEKRFDELNKWCSLNGISLINDTYSMQDWNIKIGVLEEAEPNTKKRMYRCGQCYKFRLERSANYAVKNNFNYISTTLSVSPYQYNNEIKKQLIAVAKQYKLNAVFIDFRPYYRDATKKSIGLNMYRQKYCGCKFSLQESIKQQKIKLQTKKKKALKQQQIELEAQKRKDSRKKYAIKQTRKKELLKKYKESIQ